METDELQAKTNLHTGAIIQYKLQAWTTYRELETDELQVRTNMNQMDTGGVARIADHVMSDLSSQ